MSLHVMVDLETLDTVPTAAIIAIGAVAFDPEGDGLPPLAEMSEAIGKFYIRVSLDSCLRNGLTVDGSTVSWWLRQENDARQEAAAAVDGGVDLSSALWSFRHWYQRVRPIRVWGNGSSFDISILEHAYRRVHSRPPWDYKAVRDMRTRMEDVGMKYTSPRGV